jgi:hypothetical protein
MGHLAGTKQIGIAIVAMIRMIATTIKVLTVKILFFIHVIPPRNETSYWKEGRPKPPLPSRPPGRDGRPGVPDWVSCYWSPVVPADPKRAVVPPGEYEPSAWRDVVNP